MRSGESVWLPKRAVLDMHARLLAEHGGPPGIRDEGALDSALARPLNIAAYGRPDLADLAAAYGFGLACNHAFVDGNKRISFVACVTFLRLNGSDIPIDDIGNVETWIALASGALSEPGLAAWLRSRMHSID
ncbi:type II toxin-antitoxin system death-on-curing family toxin [Lichenibacterium ramalinae]|nr:type II toxin-antitoxin system death-on-curing family toxin [Lichenibacterium ramalinae]